MCRLLCVATKGIVPHQVTSDFKRLARLGKSPPGTEKGHRSGWGVGYFPGGILRLVREPGDAFTSVRYDEVSHMAGSNPDVRVLLAHLWNAPSKELLENKDRIPPLRGTDATGREWLFAFDGNMGERRKTGEPYVVDILKETPAQRILREILAGMPKTDEKGTAAREAVIGTLRKVLRQTAEEYQYQHLNLALTDGSAVYLTRFVDKEADWNEIHFCRMNRSIVGCSEPLENIEAKWEQLANRQMLVFDYGLNITKAGL
jgi:predicted glutamine amidotransferase